MKAADVNPDDQALPLNEALCIKFAAELIETVKNLKQRRKAREENPEDTNAPDDDLQYFFHSSGLREFLAAAHKHFNLYIPLSVGQSYHSGLHPDAQVEALESVRINYERWLSEELTKENKKLGKRINITLPAELISADSAQVMNHIDPMEINLSAEGECTHLLHSDVMRDNDKIRPFIELGQQICEHYERLFETKANTTKQDNVRVKLKLCNRPTYWHELMKHFHDQDFIKALNFLERCFKFGAQKLFEKDAKKLPKDIRQKRAKGYYNNWQEDVKLNDLCYVASESVMVHLKIFAMNSVPGEDECNVMMYPGPLDLILGTIKNLLASQFNEAMSKTKCIFLRAERLNPQADDQDKYADLFLQQDDSQLECKKRRRDFIKESVGDRVPLEHAKLAVEQALTKKLRKEHKERKRSRDIFYQGKYCHFLSLLGDIYSAQNQTIAKLIEQQQVQWDSNNPFAGIIHFHKQCAQHPCEDTFLIQLSKNLQIKLQKHSSGYNSTTSNTQKREYVKRMACCLVECSAEILDAYSQDENRSKKIKVDDEYPVDDTISALDFMRAGLLFCLQRLITHTRYGFNLQEFRDQRYYPQQPSVENHTPPSTQTLSQSPSLSCRSLSRSASLNSSGSYPLPLPRSNSSQGSQNMKGY